MYKQKSQKALDFATKWHENQKRKVSEKPYIVHPISVVEQLKLWGVDKFWVHSVAYLHDLLEDTSVSPDEIKRKFGPKILKSIQQLSHTDKTPKDEWIDNLAKTAGDYVLLIKLSDRINNTRDFISIGYFEKARSYWQKSQPLVFHFKSRMKINHSVKQKVLVSINELNDIFNQSSIEKISVFLKM